MIFLYRPFSFGSRFGFKKFMAWRLAGFRLQMRRRYSGIFNSDNSTNPM